jgi:HSP20 family molecular chaperone IbpA
MMTAELVKQKGDEKEHEAAKAPIDRIRVAPNTVAYVENHKLVVEFAIPGAPTETIDVKMLEDSVYLTAPAREIEYAAALALGWPVKPGKAEATYEHGLLRIEVPLKDPMEGAVKVVIKSGGAQTVHYTSTDRTRPDDTAGVLRTRSRDRCSVFRKS